MARRFFWRRVWRDYCRALSKKARRHQGPGWRIFRQMIRDGKYAEIMEVCHG